MRGSRPTLLLGVAVLALLAVAATVAVQRSGDDAGRGPGATPSTGPGGSTGTGAEPKEPGVPTVPAASATNPTGRGRGVYRVIPCYTLTAAQLRRVLDAPMARIGQRAAGSSGSGLRGTAREDCYWFSTRPDGPYVVLSTITTGQLRDRGEDLTARTYFDTIHKGPRTYLPDIGDAAYAFGPASVAVLVGDVYLDVTVVTNGPHPLRDARDLARLLGRLQVHQP